MGDGSPAVKIIRVVDIGPNSAQLAVRDLGHVQASVWDLSTGTGC